MSNPHFDVTISVSGLKMSSRAVQYGESKDEVRAEGCIHVFGVKLDRVGPVVGPARNITYRAVVLTRSGCSS